MKWTLPVVCIATVLNIGLWLWSPPASGSRQAASNPQPEQSDRHSPAAVPMATAQCSVPAQLAPSLREAKLSPPANAKVVDQPWLNTVRDSVMQLSMSPKFANKMALTKAECAGSKCEIEGTTKQAADGQWYGTSEVASLMHTMNDGSIAGGDSGRLVSLNQVKPGRDGAEFSMTVEAHDGPAPPNPCQSVLNAWKEMHPEDWTEKNPFAGVNRQ
jgi:hypothetical protein